MNGRLLAGAYGLLLLAFGFRLDGRVYNSLTACAHAVRGDDRSVNGWDFFNNDNTVFDGATNATIDAHGTHVSGTIGGIGGNGVGVAGVNWNVKIISAKFLGPTGGSTSGAIAALNYLTNLKARYGVNIVAINNSWGGGAFDQALLDAINAAGDQNMLFIAAAGNSGTNNDTVASYPSNYQCTKGGTRGWDCVVAVAAIDSAGGLATFSQYGATTVDLGAPGVGIKSTVPNDSYASYSGTSMATPHVTGAAALCASMNPGISASAIRNAIMSTAAPTASLAGKTVTGGRLDIGAMMQACVPAASGPVSGAPTALSATPIGSSSASLTWTDGASGENRYDVERALSTGGVCGTYAVVASIAANSSAYAVLGLSGGTSYCFRVRALNSFNGGTASAYSNEAVATTPTPPPPFACAGAPYSWIDAAAGGTSYALTDDSSASVALPFPVTLYGDVYTTASISSNGFIRLGSGAATAYVNAAIPTGAEPNALIAPWWDDLNPATGGAIRSLTTGVAPNRTFTVAWVGVPHIAGVSTAVSFEAVIDEATGDITFNYLDATTGNTASDHGVGATIGLENGTGTVGTQVSFNTGSRADQTSVRCSTGAPVPLAISTAALPGASTTLNYSQMLQAVGGRLGGRGLRFLVPHLAVDDRCVALLGVALHVLPDVQHRTARGVHQRAAAPVQIRQQGDRHTERRQDDDVVRRQGVEGFAVVRQKAHAHGAQLLVDVRVVDDFAEQVDGFLGRETAAGGVGEVNGALNAVAKAELLREFDGQAGCGKFVAAGADALDECAAVMRLHLRLHGGHDVGSAEVDFLRWRGWRDR